jgi:hypothetical protein
MMTQEDKKLLLKDLCARLPYGVKVSFRGKTEVLHEAHIYQSVQTIVGESGILYDVDTPNIKPHLRPLSSMTEEEENEYRAINCYEGVFPRNEDALDYALEHHLDIRNLIEKGLALEAPEGMYK